MQSRSRYCSAKSHSNIYHYYYCHHHHHHHCHQTYDIYCIISFIASFIIIIIIVTSTAYWTKATTPYWKESSHSKHHIRCIISSAVHHIHCLLYLVNELILLIDIEHQLVESGQNRVTDGKKIGINFIGSGNDDVTVTTKRFQELFVSNVWGDTYKGST